MLSLNHLSTTLRPVDKHPSPDNLFKYNIAKDTESKVTKQP